MFNYPLGCTGDPRPPQKGDGALPDQRMAELTTLQVDGTRTNLFLERWVDNTLCSWTVRQKICEWYTIVHARILIYTLQNAHIYIDGVQIEAEHGGCKEDMEK